LTCRKSVRRDSGGLWLGLGSGAVGCCEPQTQRFAWESPPGGRAGSRAVGVSGVVDVVEAQQQSALPEPHPPPLDIAEHANAPAAEN
jgi:hypothetical protein